jgi:hypothetical protein
MGSSCRRCMENWRKFARTNIVQLAFVLLITAAIPQTKTGATSTSKKPPSTGRTVPSVRCTDPDSMVACKSFRQLVDARDKDLIDSLTGDKESKQRHFAYVCLRPKDDVFKVVEFDEPPREDFRPYTPPDGAGSLGATLFEAEALPYVEGKPATKVMDAQKKWYENHDEFSVYQVGSVYVESWEKGIANASVSDFEKWRLPLPQSHSRSDVDASFESAHQWLAVFNEANDNQFGAVDDRERPRILVDDTSVYVRYDYKNKNSDYTDYTLNIQRLTGRFTESFEAAGVAPFEDSGTCISFKY